MKTDVIKEEPIVYYHGCKGDFGCIEGGCDIDIYAHELKRAKVGDFWVTTDQDTCPNATAFGKVTYTVVYKDQDGVALLYKNELYEEIKLIWVELKQEER